MQPPSQTFSISRVLQQASLSKGRLLATTTSFEGAFSETPQLSSLESPRVGPSFQAEVPAFDGIRGTLGRRDTLLWHPDAAAPEVVEGFLRQAEQAIDDPRLVGSCDELALEALHQAAGDLSRASDALAYSVSQRVPTLWSEEETAELQDSVDAHGTNLRRVHASIANLSTRSFPECVSQHARSVEMGPLPS